MAKARGENTYRDNVRWTLADYGMVLFNIPDGFFLVGGQRISTPRFCDMHGCFNGGKHISMELKIGDHPVISKFTVSEKLHLSEIEKNGGASLIVCIEPETFTMSVFGWNGGAFLPIKEWQKIAMRKECL